MNKYVEDVAQGILAQLRQGTAPWQQPWRPGELRLPYNVATGKAYRGINTIWLQTQGYSDPRWMTYRQAEAAGAQVRRGSRGTCIVYWKFHDEQLVQGDDGAVRKIRVELERPRSFMAMVFNASQIDGLPPLEARPLDPERVRHARAAALLANSGAPIRHEPGDRAFYRASTDAITLPERSQFPTADAYYATALHELGHWTGHSSRLDRDLSHPFGSEGYAREELRAEIASLMLGDRLGIGHDPGQHAAYVASWIKALEEDPREIFRAAADAERINSYVMDFELELEANRPRWTIERRDTFKPGSQPEVIGETNSAIEALTLFRSKVDTTVIDNRTGEVAGHTGWVRDGSAPEWVPSSDLEAYATLESKGIPLPSTRAGLSMADQKVAELALMVEHHGDKHAFAHTLLRRDLAAAVVEAFGEPAAGIRASALPEHWSGEARVRPVVVEGNYEAGDLSDREPQLGEPPSEWRIEVFDRELQNWQWFATGFDVAAGDIADRLNAIGAQSLNRESQQQTKFPDAAPEQRLPVRHQPPEVSTMTPQRTYLIVPFRQKEQAKKAARDVGLRLQWDKEAKQWFVPDGDGVDVKQTTLARWLPENTTVAAALSPTPEQSFADAIRAAGLQLDGLPEMDGKIHRVAVAGDKGAERSGSYAGHLEGRIPGGYIQNYKTGERINWKYEGQVDAISPGDRERLNREAIERAERRAAEVAARHEAMAKVAQAVWNEAPPATADHPYCAAKGITNPGENGLRVVPGAVSDEAQAAGVRIARDVREAKVLRELDPQARVFTVGDLLVPARDTDGKLWSVQSVNPSFKGFMKEGRKVGLYTVAGADPSAFAVAVERDPSMPLVLAEGYATADTVARLRGHPVVVAFDSGNLNAVAGSLRERWPDRPLLIAADNDHRAEREIRPNGLPGINVGLTKAREVAATHRGAVLVPGFGARDKGSDWNDYAQQHGEETARKELDRQMAQARIEAAMNAERMMSLAREREAEARDDPTTDADNAYVANERAAAHDLMARAVAGRAEVRAKATEALVANATGAGRPPAVVNATLAKVHAEQREAIKEQRQAVLDGHNNSTESERAEPARKAAKSARRRARGHGAEL